MNKKAPIVSVILPTYNWREEWIRNSIESVLNQTYKDFELIIINDASTNDVEKVIKEYEGKDERVVYVKNEKNLKLTKTLNKWIDLAKGKYIARIDDDDIRVENKKLEEQVNFMEEHTGYWLIWTNAIIVNENWDEEYYIERPSSDKEIREKIIVWCRFIHSSIMIRKDILNKVWKYDPKWNMVEDYELWYRIGIVSKLYSIELPYVLYRVNNKWVSIKNYRKQKRMTLKIFFKYLKYYPKKHLIKALSLRLRELIVPPNITKYILSKLKNIKI